MRQTLTPLLCIAALLLGSCRGNQNNPADPGANANGNGTISGTLALYDMDGAAITDRSGVTVEVEGTSVTATTAADGSYALKHLGKGTYSLIYRRPGYIPFKVEGYQFVGEGTAFAPAVFLTEEVTYTTSITHETVSDPAGPTLLVHMTTSTPPVHRERDMLLTISTTDQFNEQDRVARIVVHDTAFTPGRSSGSERIYLEVLKRSYRVPAGTTLYLKAQAMPRSSGIVGNPVTENLRVSVLSTPATATSNVTTFLVP